MTTVTVSLCLNKLIYKRGGLRRLLKGLTTKEESRSVRLMSQILYSDIRHIILCFHKLISFFIDHDSTLSRFYIV